MYLCKYLLHKADIAQFKQTLVDKEGGDFYQKKIDMTQIYHLLQLGTKIMMIYHHIKLPIFWVHPPIWM